MLNKILYYEKNFMDKNVGSLVGYTNRVTTRSERGKMSRRLSKGGIQTFFSQMIENIYGSGSCAANQIC